jgi:hypothetical protein
MTARPVLRLVPPPLETTHAGFARRRRDCHMAFLRWLRENPPAADIALEIDASISALRQLAILATGGRL